MDLKKITEEIKQDFAWKPTLSLLWENQFPNEVT